MKPIYCIEEYEYFNPYGIYAYRMDQIFFLVIFSCRKGEAQFRYSMSELVKACQEHEPRLYKYIENLLADIEEFCDSDTRLVRALEQDGFDMSRLLYVLFDNEDLEKIADWIEKVGKNKERTTVEQIQQFITKNDCLLEWGLFLNRRKELSRIVYEAIKELALDYLPTLYLLDTNLIRSFNKCMDNYALMMVDMSVTKWEQMDRMDAHYYYDDDDDEGYGVVYDKEYEEEEKEGAASLFSLEGQRQFHINLRKNSPVAGCEDNPIFCVEIVEILEEWELRGWNRVRIWYKLTCAEGDWYDEIDFEYLMNEAIINFPDIHADAMKYYQASSSPRPRHPAMLRGIQRKGHDLTPVLASYVSNRLNFLPEVKEEMRYRRVSPTFQNTYVERRKWDVEERDPVHVEEFQLVNLLRDGFVNEGMAVILREMTEFHIRVPKSYLNYMKDWLHNTYIDPLNDLHKVLDKVFELRRGNRRE